MTLHILIYDLFYVSIIIISFFYSRYTTDSVASIRDSAVEVIRQLYILYGDSFAEDTIFPTVSDLVHHEHYLLRVTGIHIITVRL